MATPDTLSRIRSEIDARLHELRPAVEEYQRLEIGIGALEQSASAPPSRERLSRARTKAPRASARTTRARQSPVAKRPARTPETRGPRQRAVV
jgi:hypothetical protein